MAKKPIPQPVEQGNIDLANRTAQYKNKDGSISTIRSITITEDGMSVLIPTIGPNGKLLSNTQAIALYRKSGQHLGKFAQGVNAEPYAVWLHNQEAQRLASGGSSAAREAQLTAKVKELFPQFAFLLDPNSGFGADVAALLKKAVVGGYEPARFQAEYQNTKYYTTTSASVRAWDAATPAARETGTASFRTAIQDNYGDVINDPATLEKVAQGAARLGLSGTALKHFVFAQAALTGAANDIKQSSEADRIRKLASDYGYRLSDSELQSVLTGTLPEQQLTERAKQALLGEMPNLKPQLDAGLTLSNVFGNYQSLAAKTLELDPNTVNVSDGKFRQALSASDGKGGFRQLSLGEWEQKLRTDPQYGYQFTKQANRDATSIALSIARAFGKVS